MVCTFSGHLWQSKHNEMTNELCDWIDAILKLITFCENSMENTQKRDFSLFLLTSDGERDDIVDAILKSDWQMNVLADTIVLLRRHTICCDANEHNENTSFSTTLPIHLQCCSTQHMMSEHARFCGEFLRHTQVLNIGGNLVKFQNNLFAFISRNNNFTIYYRCVQAFVWPIRRRILPCQGLWSHHTHHGRNYVRS